MEGNPHPSSYPLSLFFSRVDAPSILQKATSPIFRDYWGSLLQANQDADRQFLTKEVDFHNQIGHIPRLCEILRREAFIYALTGKKERGELAKLALQTAMKFERWDYFVEAGNLPIGLQRAPETTLAMSVAYDWLGEMLSHEERREVEKQIGDKGCDPCWRSLYGMRYPDKVVGWGFDPASVFKEPRDFRRWPLILDKTNLKAVPASALGIGALVLLDKDPRAEDWLEMALWATRTFLQLYSPDGSYPEGLSYWSYATSNIILFLEALRRVKGTDLFDEANFLGMIEYALAMQMPDASDPKGVVNFGDNPAGFSSMIGFWVARRAGDGLSQHAALHHAARHEPYSIIWFDPSVKEVKPSRTLHVKRLDLDWVILRTGWEVDDLVFALRSGGPANHEHADRNSFILKAFGERLLNDHKGVPYDWRDPAWPLRLSMAHNCVFVDGRGHQYHDGREGTNPSQASAKIVRFVERDDYVYFTSDATPAYRLIDGDIERVQRTVVWVKPYYFILVDQFAKRQRPSTFQCRFHPENSDGKAGLVSRESGFVIQRPRAELVARVAGDFPLRVSQEKLLIPPERGLFPFIEVSTMEKATSATVITALLPLPKAQSPPSLTVAQEGDGWQVAFETPSQKTAVTVRMTGAIPEVEVR